MAEKEEMAGRVAEEIPDEKVVPEAEGHMPEAELVAESVVGLGIDNGVSVVLDLATTRDAGIGIDDRVAGLRDRLSDKNMLVDWEIVPLEG